MLLSTWNIGLDVHNDHFFAVALQKKRYGWHLRGWWRIQLDQPVYNQQGLFNQETLVLQLRQWRKLLPKFFSLRLALPDHLTIQRPLKLPTSPLSPMELQWYVESAVNSLFPLSAKELAIDYRRHCVGEQPQLLITATRKTELALWNNALKQAGLVAEVFDIAPCILRVIAHYAKVPEDHLLIHKTENGLLLVSPLQDDFYFEHLTLPDFSLNNGKDIVCLRYSQASKRLTKNASLSGDIEALTITTAFHLWSPFSAVQRLQPPMPTSASAFTIACGLALRDRDNVTSQFTALA